MNKRLLIRKLAIPAAVTAGVSILVLLSLVPISDARFETHKEEFKKYINAFMDENAQYLRGVAARIKSPVPSQNLVSELQAEYTTDHQKSDRPKKYLWMTSLTGEFLFGVPAEDFQKANNAFDKYQERIKADDFYRDRNDFLSKLIDKINVVDFAQFEGSERADRRHRESAWRFYDGDEGWSLMQPLTSNFVAPVYDGTGKLAGKLYMKVDDRAHIDNYLDEGRFGQTTAISRVRGFAVFFLIVSGIFLWFLLPTWVYVDAQERDVKSPGVWAFLALTSLIFGLTIYLITRPNTLKTFTCPECKRELNGATAYCPHCGYDLSNNYCPQCQYPIDPNWKFCPDCRAEIKRKDTGGEDTRSVEQAASEA